MNKYHFLSMVFFIVGIIFFALGVTCGEVKTGFIVFIPFLVGTGFYALAGFLLFFIAMVLFMFGFVESSFLEFSTFYDEKPPVETKSSVEGGGVILIGPIPIVFGSNWRIAVALMFLAFILMVTMFLLLNL